MNSDRETKGDPIGERTPPESLLPAHASPASINELTERGKKLEEEVAVAVAALKTRLESLESRLG
jgi:hypothetical protein